MPFTILAQAEEKLQYEKHEWLQSHILHRELQEIILDYELQAHDTALSTADKEVSISLYSMSICLTSMLKQSHEDLSSSVQQFYNRSKLELAKHCRSWRRGFTWSMEDGTPLKFVHLTA